LSTASTAPAASASMVRMPSVRFSAAERTTMGVGQWAMMSSVACSPSTRGIIKSMVTTSGRRRWHSS
jgi:hypothetical protein